MDDHDQERHAEYDAQRADSREGPQAVPISLRLIVLWEG